jgi:prepilin-type N-terminal cleavage/methylation domain-containing protein/prepilin-type processing-associated H-X9-DG protein
MKATLRIEKLRTSKRAFSLIELLAVIAVIAILAGLLLPALTSAKTSARTVQCVGDKKQLQLAWHLYATDHNDQIPPNGEVVGPPQTNHQYWWAQGVMNYDGDHPDNTNSALLIDPRYAKLGEYTQAPGIYRCPEDKSSVLSAGTIRSRVRSVSMNVHVGRCIDCFGDRPTHLGPRIASQLPNPGKQFIFIDEHPDSISSTLFWIDRGEGRFASISSFPSPLHNGGATLSFADGHAEFHRWTDPRTKPQVRGENYLTSTETPNNPDVEWLQEHTNFP